MIHLVQNLTEIFPQKLNLSNSYNSKFYKLELSRTFDLYDFVKTTIISFLLDVLVIYVESSDQYLIFINFDFYDKYFTFFNEYNYSRYIYREYDGMYWNDISLDEYYLVNSCNLIYNNPYILGYFFNELNEHLNDK